MLLLPSANRVYAKAAMDLMQAELRVMSHSVLDHPPEEIAAESFGGVPYLTCAAPAEFSDRDTAFLARLSSLYALFAITGEGLLRPVELPDPDRLDEDLVTIQKYPGKTNEQFTRMLLNIAVLSSDSAAEMIRRPLRVLDPLCGRGTTLNQALRYGWHADGMDLDGKDFDAYATFLRTWLKRKRIKHTAEVSRVRRDRKTIGRKFEVALGLSKEDWKRGDTRRLRVVQADTTRAGDFFRPYSYDVIVADAPYGVQHGSRQQGELARSPLDLLDAALPGWVRLLRPGGAVGVSWNTHVARREEVVKLFAGHGLEVLDSGPYRELAHRVDQAVVRDAVIARNPVG